MFDISFFKIAVIGAVALVVLGPERLPKVAKTAGHLFGRIQRYVNGVKADIAREIESSELANIKKEVVDAARSFEQTLQQQAGDFKTGAKSLEESARNTIGGTVAMSEASPQTLPDMVALDSTTYMPASATSDSSATGGLRQNVAPVLGLGAISSNESVAPADHFGQGLFDFGVEAKRPVLAKANAGSALPVSS